MIAAELDLDLPDTSLVLSKIAPMLERAANEEALRRVMALDSLLAEMERNGYEIGTPVRVCKPTPFAYAKWHIPLKHAGSQCVLSIFINEIIESDHDHHNRKQRNAARYR